jgi:hypothetical protein
MTNSVDILPPSFGFAQTFYVDPETVNGAQVVMLYGIDLFFKRKPNPSGQNNTSNLDYPGATLALVSTTSSEVPDLGSALTNGVAVLSYNEIVADSTAVTPSTFIFKRGPVFVETGKYYALVVSFDGDDPCYEVWKNTQNDYIVGTNTRSTGSAGAFRGKYYDYINSGTWTPRNDTDLKMSVYCKKFYSNNAVSELVNEDYEFITYDAKGSLSFRSEEFVYQRTGYLRGTLNVNTSSLTIVGTNTTFLTSGFNSGDYVVITDGTQTNTTIKRIQTVSNNSLMYIAEVPEFGGNYEYNGEGAPPFTNSSAYYMRTPVAKLYNDNFSNSKLILTKSSVNTAIQQNNFSYFRFVNNTISNIAITVGGTGFKNGDIVIVFSNASVSPVATINASATVTTNVSGGIVSLNITNNGLGFVTGGNVAFLITNASSGATSGSAQTLNASIGSTLVGLTSGATVNVTSVYNRSINLFDPEIVVGVPPTTAYSVNANFSSNSSGNYKIDSTKEFKMLSMDLNTIAQNSSYIMSRSEEVQNSSNLYSYEGVSSKSAIVKVNLISLLPNSSVYSTPYIDTENLNMYFYNNKINNDSTNEHTYYGNATTKHITTRIDLNNNRAAEDLVVYLDAYQPTGTTIEVYARLYNYSDNQDAFDDKNWTKLIANTSTSDYGLSSSINPYDIKEFAYELPYEIPANTTVTGTVTVSTGSNTVTGQGTFFSANVATGDVVKIYSPYFSNTNFFYAQVVSIASNTSLTISKNTANASILGSGFLMDVAKYHENGFKNIQNSNILRYYNTENSEFDAFNSFAIKIVLLASDPSKTPRVRNIRAIGVSA